MHMLYSIVYSWIFITKSICCRSKPTKCMRTFDLTMCYSTESSSIKRVDCSEADVCKKEFYITYVKLEPYSSEIVADLLRTCCGGCINVTEVNVLRKTSLIPSPFNITSHFVFPVLGRTHFLKLYGYHFIPLIKTPSVYYITQKNENQMQQLLSSCVNMWPLIIICLLMVAISGFIGWLLETSANKEQFPRSFLAGWFEGFWWSFVSMTTVGYGDKVPKSVSARLFSILWIFVGITTFSLVTAMLSSEITEANTPPTPSMSGSTVGAIRHRLYDAMLIEKHGGILIDIDPVNITEGINQMINNLTNREIDGFVLDRYTLLLFNRHFEKSPAYKQSVKFLKTKIIKTEVSYPGAQFSYGILVKNQNDYDFLADVVAYNRDVINTCNGLLINNYSREAMVEQEKNPLFSSAGGMFWKAFITISIIIAIICCFGGVYELRRRSYLCRRRCLLI